VVIVATAAKAWTSEATASRKGGQQESTDCHIGKTVQLQQKRKSKEEVSTRNNKDGNKNSKQQRGLQTLW